MMQEKDLIEQLRRIDDPKLPRPERVAREAVVADELRDRGGSVIAWGVVYEAAGARVVRKLPA